MDLQFKNRCNGYRLDSPSLSVDALLTLSAILPEARREFEAFLAATSEAGRHGEYHLGTRYGSDDMVRRRIESAIRSEEEFLADPLGWALDGLRECASADHWYTYEKQWD